MILFKIVEMEFGEFYLEQGKRIRDSILAITEWDFLRYYFLLIIPSTYTVYYIYIYEFVPWRIRLARFVDRNLPRVHLTVCRRPVCYILATIVLKFLEISLYKSQRYETLPVQTRSVTLCRHLILKGFIYSS